MTVSNESLLDSAQSWSVAAASAVIAAITFGTVYSFSAFFESMANEFDSGLGRTSIVFAITTFLYFSTGALTGPLADRWGVRPLVIVGGAMFAVGLFWTSRVGELWHGYLTFGIGVGMGGGVFISSVFAMNAQWFDRHRGAAQGIVASGSGLGTLVLVPLAERLIASYGWRTAYELLAAIAAVTFLLTSVFLQRPPIEPVERDFPYVKTVLASPIFARFGLGVALQMGVVVAAFAFVSPFATAQGVSAQTAAILVGAIGAASIAGRLFLTGLADRIGPITMLQVSLVTESVAFALWLLIGGNVALLALFVAILGVGYGGFVALVPLVTAELFGLRSFGAVFGWVFLTSGVGSLFIPPLVGFVSDGFDTQLAPKLVLVVCSVAGAAILLGLPKRSEILIPG